jgi:hypothetical protein
MRQFGLSCSSLDSCTWTLNEGNNVRLVDIVQADNYCIPVGQVTFQGSNSLRRRSSKSAVLNMILLRFMVCQLRRAMEDSSSTRTAKRLISSCIHSRFFTVDLLLVILLHRSGNIDLQCLQLGSCCFSGGFLALLFFIQPPISHRSSKSLEVRHVEELNSRLKLVHAMDFSLRFADATPAGQIWLARRRTPDVATVYESY